VDISNGDTLADEVEININMLCVLMLDEVGEEVDRADVVAIEEGSPRQASHKGQTP
jgi:hypothetical protein